VNLGTTQSPYGSPPLLISGSSQSGAIYYPVPFTFYNNGAHLDWSIYFAFSVYCPSWPFCEDGFNALVFASFFTFVVVVDSPFSFSFFFFFFFFYSLAESHRD